MSGPARSTEFLYSLAALLYDEYCCAVGGKAFNGDPLPTWEDFRADSMKQKQSDAWVRVADLAIRALRRE